MLGIRLRIWFVVVVLLASTWRVFFTGVPAGHAPDESGPTTAQVDPPSPAAAPAPVSPAALSPATDSGAPAPETRRVETGSSLDPSPPVGAPSATRPPAPAAVDTQLVILEDEAAREALRRGLTVSGASGGAGRARGDGSTEREILDQDPDGARRTLSDELLVDHLAAEVYRTTVFSQDQDGVGETRAAALQLIRSLTPEDRRELLASALADSDRNARPVFEESPRMARLAIP